MGTIDGPTNYLASVELYNPAFGNFSSAGAMSLARAHHTATRLANGRVLLAGGYDGAFLGGAELFRPDFGNFSTAGNLNFPRDYHTATQLYNGRVLIVGGQDGGTVLGSAELFR
jgi:hypothetical protein